MKALQAEIETILAQLREQMFSLRKGIQTQLAIAEQSLKAMEENLKLSQDGAAGKENFQRQLSQR